MAILQLLSDIHLEHMQDHGVRFLDALDPEGVDVLVLAGDTMPVCNAMGYPSEKEIDERGTYLKKCLIRVKRTNGQVTFPNGQPGGGW